MNASVDEQSEGTPAEKSQFSPKIATVTSVTVTNMEPYPMAVTETRTEPYDEEITNTPPEDVECRSCLQRFDYEAGLIDMFQAWEPPWNGMSVTIAEDLAQIANIEITQEDSYSKLICQFCHQKLLDACSFVVNVRINDRLLRQRAEMLTEQEDSWPKPIQIDRNVNSDVYNTAMDVEIKQEVLSDDETYTNRPEETFKEGADATDETENVYNDLEIKIEPEEIIRPPPYQITVNGRDDGTTTDTSTGSRGPRVKNAQYYRDYRARKRAEQEKESLNRSDPSTKNVVGSGTSKKKKSAAEYQREYRARKKAKRDNILVDSLAVIPLTSKGGFITIHPLTIVDQLTTAEPSTSSDIGFAKRTRKKTSAEYQREYRARKKAQRESTRAAKTNDGSMESADEDTSNIGDENARINP